jgi:hypothetical protein
MDLHRATLALHDLEVDAEGWLVGAGVEHVPSTPAQSAWLRQHAEADVAALTFDERLALVEAEWTFRENRVSAAGSARPSSSFPRPASRTSTTRRAASSTRASSASSPPPRWSPSTKRFDHRHDRHREDVPCLRLGPTGPPQGVPGDLPRRLSSLLRARSGPRRWLFARALNRFARVDVLVLDDWAMAPIKDDERRDLLELLEDRYGTRSTWSPASLIRSAGTTTSPI